MDHEVLVALLIGAVVALIVVGWVRRTWRSVRARARAGRAIAGEVEAEALLRAAGYRIVGRQVRALWWPLLDGEPLEIEVRADYLVTGADAELLVAEVKTGRHAPELGTTATRRQLLEYWRAFEVDAVLLVCPERAAIHRVEFGAVQSDHFARCSRM